LSQAPEEATQEDAYLKLIGMNLLSQLNVPVMLARYLPEQIRG